MRVPWIVILGLLCALPVQGARGENDPRRRCRAEQGGCKGKKRPEAKSEPAEPAAAPVEAPPLVAAAAEPAKPAEDEAARVEAAKKELSVEGRKRSALTPGTPSRWSNKGAMIPIAAEVPITAPLPERALPVAAGQVTPGQALVGSEELLQARISLGAYHLATRGQDVVYTETLIDPNQPLGGYRVAVVDGQSRDINLYRGRASLAYERIAGSDLGAHLDLEYRARANGSRPTDHRINELYVSYGLTDFQRPGGIDYGLAFGRVAIREAGYAQADGVAARLRLGEELRLGIFGGLTGNPYGYNWSTQQTQEFSADWIRGGAFLAYRSGRIFANVAGVATYAKIDVEHHGLDRLYFYLDAAYLLTEELNLFLTGWVDIVGGQPVQNLEAVAAYSLGSSVDLRVGLGRFTTLVYDVSTAYSYAANPDANRIGANSTAPNAVLVDPAGAPIIPYDAALATTVYNSARLRVGYRPLRTLQVYATTDAFLRETGATNQELQAAGVEQQIQFSALRVQPGAGAAFRDPEIIDLGASVSYILDKQSQAKAFAQASVGRGYEGFYLGIDGRMYFGDIDGLDGGLDLSYVLPEEWFPGRVMLHATARLFRENLALVQIGDLAKDTVLPADQLPVLPKQSSFLGFAGLEWRL